MPLPTTDSPTPLLPGSLVKWGDLPALQEPPEHGRYCRDIVTVAVLDASPADLRLPAVQEIAIDFPVPHGLAEITTRASATRARFENRLRVLAEEAETEEYAFNPGSQAAFRWFIEAHPFLKTGRLFLMENGNLRATWKDTPDTHVGIQFLPDATVQYVIFVRRRSSRKMSRVHGYDTLDGILRLLEAFDLGHILDP